MARSLFFCYGCNERFETGEDADARCPLCGESLDDMATVPTAAAGAAGDREALPTSARRSTDALIGGVLESYRVDGYLGSGGMARVYRAFHSRLERPCALKVLSPELAERSPELIDAFLAEARAAASLVHPNVVTVHNVGEDAGVHFIELELVAGRSLHRLVVEDGPLPPGRAAALLGQAITGLAEAHRQGLVHRDLKPANVLLQERRPAKLADFGRPALRRHGCLSLRHLRPRGGTRERLHHRALGGRDRSGSHRGRPPLSRRARAKLEARI